MAAYCGAIGNVNVLEFVSTDLFDESQENQYLLQQHAHHGASSPSAKLHAAPVPSPTRKHMSVQFAELPLDDPNEMTRTPPSPSKVNWSPQGSPKLKRQSGPTPIIHYPTSPAIPLQPQPSPLPAAYVPGFSQEPRTPPPPPSASTSPPANRPSITITLPLGFPTSNPNASSATTLAEEVELHKLLYSLTQLGLGQYQPPPVETTHQQPPTSPQHPFQAHYVPSVSVPTSPTSVSSSSLWLSSPTASSTTESRTSTSSHQGGTASLMFRPLPSRQSRRMTARQSRRYSSAPNSPQRDASPDGFFSSDDATQGQVYASDEYKYGRSQPSSPQRSRGSVTFLTVKNLLRGGGALARTVRREQSSRRPTCMGTISSRLKRREKFHRPTVITDAYHRVSDMKLGTSPMKVKIKHMAFPQLWKTDANDWDEHHEADPGMPSPKGQLRKESLVTLETLDKIGTRHACPVQLIEEPLPDYSNVQPRVDAWNTCKKPKKDLRRPSTWLLGATATSTPHDLQDY